MAVKSLNDIMSLIKARVGDDTSDEVITLLEDVTDTFTDYETRISEAGDWKTKYEENDRVWRDKYTSRFYDAAASATEVNTINGVPEYDVEEPEILTFDDLFTEVKD